MAQQRDRSEITPGNGGTQRYVQPGDDIHLQRAEDGHPVEDRSLVSLVKELGDEGSRLIREEVQLAKTELREKIDVYERNTVKMVVGGVLLLGALFVLLVAVNRGLTVVLGQFMDPEVAVWLAPLVIAFIAGVTGWSMTQSAKEKIKREGLAPSQTIETLRQDKNFVQQQAREVRHG